MMEPAMTGYLREDIDDLHLVVPVQIHPGKVLGDGTQVSVVGETRLLMQQGLSVL